MRQASRRTFLKSSGIALGATALAAANSTEAALLPGKIVKLAKGSTILFQGDSITDAGRTRDTKLTATPNNQAALGKGYAWLAAVQLLIDRKGDNLKIFNRGISGNKVFQLADRWQKDCLDLKPDVLSILIGVNDMAHSHIPRLNYQGTVEIYERDYHALLERTRKALPKVKLIICEPFLLNCGETTDAWIADMNKYRAVAKRLADKHRAVFVPFQSMFDEATKYASPDNWAKDGVHPDPNGAALMAHFWTKAVGA